MNSPFAEIGADGCDTEKALRDIEEAAAGMSPVDEALDTIRELDIKALKDNTEVLSRVIAHMRESAVIDIGDFEIVNTGGPFGRLEVLVKKTIWKLLRFYTYRMFSQQRAFNMQVVAVLEAMWRRLEEVEREESM